MSGNSITTLNMLYALDINDTEHFSHLYTRPNKENLTTDETKRLVNYGDGKVEYEHVCWKQLSIPIDLRKVHVYDGEPVYLFNLKFNMKPLLDFESNQLDKTKCFHFTDKPSFVDFELSQIADDEDIPFDVTDEFMEEWEENHDEIEIAHIASLFTLDKFRGNKNLYEEPSCIQWLIKY